jgi:hypothetical protein
LANLGPVTDVSDEGYSKHVEKLPHLETTPLWGKTFPSGKMFFFPAAGDFFLLTVDQSLTTGKSSNGRSGFLELMSNYKIGGPTSLCL